MRGYRSRLLPELGIIICIIGIILANNIAVSGDQSEVQHTNDLVWGTLLLGYEEILVPEQTIYLMNGLEVHADYVHLANWIYYDVYYEITRLSDNASIHKEPVYEDHIGDGTGGWKSITPSSFSQEGIYQINYTIHDTTNDIVGSMIKTFEVNSSHHYKAPEIISTYGIENGSSYSENLNVKSFIISELQILEGFASIGGLEQRFDLTFNILEFGPRNPDENEFIGAYKINSDVTINITNIPTGTYNVYITVINIEGVNTTQVYSVEKIAPDLTTEVTDESIDTDTSITTTSNSNTSQPIPLVTPATEFFPVQGLIGLLALYRLRKRGKQ